MIEVHDYIHSRSADDSTKGMVDQALPSLAALIARKARILCFDEFHVVDITDAMILGRLFKILFEHDVIVVATSNWAADDLYKDGLQRDRFLPFIALFKSKVEEIHLDSPHDYRAQTKQIAGTYFTPLNRATQKTMDAVFETLTDGAIADEESFEVKGREIFVREAVGGYARFTFAQLCERPHGAEDYLEIARRYHTVFLEGVPKLSYDRRNEAKRLMNLIDALYERRVRVIISAATKPDKLYAGHDHAYEFERTISLLLEMQSDEYP
jgi:cell division protein ZapE